MKNALNLSRKIQLRKKSTIFNVIFIVLAVLIVFSFQSYSKSAKNYLKSGDEYKSVYFNSLEVAVSENDDIEEIKEKIKKMEHISIVTNFYNYNIKIHTKDFITDSEEGNINLHIATNDTLPEITYGNKFPNDESNYIICPEKLYKIDNRDKLRTLSINQTIDMKNFLNKDLNVYYRSNYGTNYYSKKFTIVGLYKPESFLDFDVCYAQEKTINNVVVDMYSDDVDEENGINNIEIQRSLFVLFDDIKNIDEVYKQLDDAGLYYVTNSSIIPEYFENIEKTANIVSFVVILLVVVIILIVSYKQYNEDKKTYKLLNYLGYRRKEIIKILICNTLIQVFIAIIISLIAIILFYYLFKLIMYYYPFLLYGYKLCLNIYSILMIYIMVIIVSLISCYINELKIKKGMYNENISA